MGSPIIKVAPNQDLYVEWSTVVDDATNAGTREQFLDMGYDPQRLERADAVGSSSWDGTGTWGDDGLIVRSNATGREMEARFLPRRNLGGYVALMLAAKKPKPADVLRLTEPLKG